MKRTRVNASRPYDILIAGGLLPETGTRVRECLPPCRIALFTDSNVAPLYADPVTDSLTKADFDVVRFTFPAGEPSKNLTTYGRMLEFLADSHLTRSDAAVALGGGVTGDLTGFAAATYLRGIRFIQIPTTLLAAVDSSVGGKTGLDLSAGKNLAGAFWQPSLVLCDTDTFRSLPEVELQNGIAEAVKTGALADASLFPLIRNGDYPAVVQRSVEIKASVVEQDERDTGLRQLLNFGHTVGHSIEKLSGYQIPHGLAVAKGMPAEARAAFRMGLTPFSAEPYLTELLEALGFDLSIPFAADDLYQAALNDKKRKGNRMTVIVPTEKGRCELRDLSLEELKEYFRLALSE